MGDRRRAVAGGTRPGLPPCTGQSPVLRRHDVDRPDGERLFNKLKNWRRVATRYDKTAQSYIGFVSVASALLWLPFVQVA